MSRTKEFSFGRWGQEVHRFQWMAGRGFALAWTLLAGGFALAQHAPVAAPQDVVPGRLLVMYRSSAIAPELDAQIRPAGGHVERRLENLGIAVVSVPEQQAEQLRTNLAARAEVAFVAHDRVIHGATLRVRAITPDVRVAMTPDSFYTVSQQDWAVKQVGGYGSNAVGGPSNKGPWDNSTGKGVTIAVLDSGVDPSHPDISPNLVSATSLIDQTALPSTCDDGTSQDEAGHGTWVASLAMAAMGPRTGLMVGVAPQASLISIKVLERVPAAGSGTTAQLCTQGTTSGLMSWLLAGITSASQAGANIISISAGGLLDSYSGESAGLIAMFNRAAWQATQNGALVIAAVGNDGRSLDNSRYIEMPAQATGVLPVMATTNPACAQNTATGAACTTGPVSLGYYSNYGTTLEAVAAPGGSYPQGSATGVSGFVRGACSSQGYGCFGLGPSQYVEAIGTSASAPLVAGVAAILKGAQPALTPAQLAALIRSSALLNSSTLPQANAATALQVQ